MAVRQSRKLYLSKSLFTRGLQCHKSLYLDRYHPELKDEASESVQMVLQGGTDTGILARELFPGGVEIPYEELSHQDQLKETQRQIEKGTPVLYEPAFAYDDIFIKADILRKADNAWELYEVKASTSLKDYYIYDAAVQYYVITGAGIPLSRVSLVYINNQYVRKGDTEVHKLFAVEDITEQVLEVQNFVTAEIVRMREMLTKEDEPAIHIGEYCNDPYDCDFQGHCWEHIPENSVFDLRGRGAKPFDLYRKGIVHLEDVPMEILSDRQAVQLEAFLTKGEFTKAVEVKEFLDTLWYPLYFLDFETFMSPIPPFDGTRPYQQIPFQYSLHYLESEGAELGHYEYLAEPNVDHREELTKKLIREIPENACVLAFNAGFEIAILRSLGGWFPRYQKKIQAIVDNTRDLAVPFRRMDVYHWKMGGSYSQKAVLPVLVPELSYDDMEIADGGMAMSAYPTMCQSQDPAEIEKIRQALLEYCGLDTLGMVKILEKLKEVTSVDRER